MTNCLSQHELERSWVVANSRMNRQRGLAGVNSYEQELGFHPLESLRDCIARRGTASWLDLCCGEGRALIAADRELNSGETIMLQGVGVDLTNHFAAIETCRGVRFFAASLHSWQPDRSFDLITCVHGLHYVGDKLGLLQRASTWLEPNGMLVAHLDPANIHIDGAALDARKLRAMLPSHWKFDARRSLLTASQPGVTFPMEYLGADDSAGPNLTGQDAVNSHYQTQVSHGR
jgi:SAM-dependent methyltransferase